MNDDVKVNRFFAPGGKHEKNYNRIPFVNLRGLSCCRDRRLRKER